MWGDLDKSQIDDLLKSELIGRLGCFDGNKVYVVPITFAYNDGYIYGHTKDGLKIQMMRNNPNVCFEIDWMKDMSNWKSVNTVEIIKMIVAFLWPFIICNILLANLVLYLPKRLRFSHVLGLM